MPPQIIVCGHGTKIQQQINRALIKYPRQKPLRVASVCGHVLSHLSAFSFSEKVFGGVSCRMVSCLKSISTFRRKCNVFTFHVLLSLNYTVKRSTPSCF